MSRPWVIDHIAEWVHRDLREVSWNDVQPGTHPDHRE